MLYSGRSRPRLRFASPMLNTCVKVCFSQGIRARVIKRGTHLSLQASTWRHAPFVTLTYSSWSTDFEIIETNVC